ncbi:MAG TPA: pseudouridine synthase [Candidatus Saccharimonadales bacterium]|nr:pseudouridine synthase [Candidatus Saccharimonadales bacterium]
MNPQNDVPQRANKFIATHLAIGRRAADDLIAKGKVLINGEKAELGSRVYAGDKVTVDGKKVDSVKTNYLYVLMDKPVGYVCSRRQQGDVPTIYSLLPQKYDHLKTVGRLDKDSSGLILLTNNGDLAHQLTHPSFKKVKTYDVQLSKPLEPLHRQMISDIGIDLPDGKSKLLLERLTDGDETSWQVTMHEGRNRQIRRTFLALGYTVISLRRKTFGKYSLDQLNGKQILEIEQ